MSDDETRTPGATRPLVHAIDHFYSAVENPGPTVEALAETLGLPVAWRYDGDGAFGNAAIELGNAQFELLNWPGMGEDTVPCTPARIQGIALEPPPIDDEFTAQLARRGLRALGLGAASDAELPEPTVTESYTILGLPDLIPDSRSYVFFCRYHYPRLRDRVRRARALSDCGGGRLGVTGVVELVVGSATMESQTELWQRLFNPEAPLSPGHWKVGRGPALRLVDAQREAVEQVVIGVRSLSHTTEQAQTLGIFGEEADGGIQLVIEELNGLNIRLVETT